jgi:hypothetical protein
MGMEAFGGFPHPLTEAIELLFHDLRLLIKKNEIHYIVSFMSGAN